MSRSPWRSPSASRTDRDDPAAASVLDDVAPGVDRPEPFAIDWIVLEGVVLVDVGLVDVELTLELGGLLLVLLLPDPRLLAIGIDQDDSAAVHDADHRHGDALD